MGELLHDGLAIPARVVLAHEPPFTLAKLRINPATRLVENGARSEVLEPRVMQVLVVLGRAGGAIVTRDELIERCWDNRIVGEDAINRALSRIRHVAAEIGEGSFTVQTITKVGYRLLVDGVAALPEMKRDAPAASQPSVCVLPFVNMSGDADQEYFSDGICEDITTDLSKLSGLSVSARNTAFTFKGGATDVRTVARRLGVTHVLEGSVRKIGNRVRISAQLIDGQTGNHAWAERYDRDLTDIFAIQDEISQAIAAALKLQLLPNRKRSVERRGTESVEAYDLYLMARQYRAAGYFCDLPREEAIARICKRAVEIDPHYADAWALLALAQGNLFRAYTVDESADDGSAAAEHAVRLNPNIAEAHLPRAWRLAVDGLNDEASAALATAIALSPNSWDVNWEAGRIFYRQRRLREAAQCLARAAEQAEDTEFHSWGMLAACYSALEDEAAAAACAKKLLERVQGLTENPVALAYSAWCFAKLGQAKRASDCAARALLLGASNLFVRYTLAWIALATTGERDAAIELLDPYLTRARKAQIWIVANDPNIDSLRSDHRFATLLAAAIKRVQLSATVVESAALNVPYRCQ